MYGQTVGVARGNAVVYYLQPFLKQRNDALHRKARLLVIKERARGFVFRRLKKHDSVAVVRLWKRGCGKEWVSRPGRTFELPRKVSRGR